MPTMPNANNAFIEPAKLATYILDPTHRIGWPKGLFLASIGFDPADVAAIERALLAHAAAHEATVTPTEFGVVYEVDGALVSPDGRVAAVRTVWNIDTGMTAPRFITLVPLPRIAP